MREFRFLSLQLFKRLPVGEQRQYLAGVKAHLDAATRIHEKAKTTLVPRPQSMGGDLEKGSGRT